MRGNTKLDHFGQIIPSKLNFSTLFQAGYAFCKNTVGKYKWEIYVSPPVMTGLESLKCGI
jgi:hypothetical protein